MQGSKKSTSHKETLEEDWREYHGSLFLYRRTLIVGDGKKRKIRRELRMVIQEYSPEEVEKWGYGEEDDLYVYDGWAYKLHSKVHDSFVTAEAFAAGRAGK